MTTPSQTTPQQGAGTGTPTPRTPWAYCPECGDANPRAAGYTTPTIRQCKCLQEWFTDIDYTDVVQTNLGKRVVIEAQLATAKQEVEAIDALRKLSDGQCASLINDLERANRHRANLEQGNAALRAELARLRSEVESERTNLKSEQKFSKENHQFFLAALEAVGMKGEVGSLNGLQRQIVEKILALRSAPLNATGEAVARAIAEEVYPSHGTTVLIQTTEKRNRLAAIILRHLNAHKLP